MLTLEQDDSKSGEYMASRDLSTGTDIKSVYLPTAGATQTQARLMPSGGGFNDIETIMASTIEGGQTCFDLSDDVKGDVTLVRLEVVS